LKNNFYGNNFIFLFITLFSLMAIDHNCYSDEQEDNRIIYEDSFFILCHANTLYMKDNEQTMAFFCLFENENAINIFIELLRESETGVGMFYALLGLFEHDEYFYYEIIKSVNLNILVRIRPIRSADYIFGYDLNELRTMIESGRFMSDLKINRG